MNAAEIAAALGDARRDGTRWRCRCPLCSRRNFTLRDGDKGLLPWCWNGCHHRDLFAELRRRGLLDGSVDYARRIISAPHRADDGSRIARAFRIWNGARDGVDTIVAQYLASRKISLDQWPATLRFNPRCPRPKDGDGNLVAPLPAMLGLIEHVEHGPIGVHCTYLRTDGNDKADVERQKAIFGASAGGVVRFGEPRAGAPLVVGEGIESTLSAALPCGLPAWAALSAEGIKKVILPAEATHVVIAADNDINGTGARAAQIAARRWLAEGRRVRIAMPTEPGTDFNDVLCGRTAVQFREVPDVAA